MLANLNSTSMDSVHVAVKMEIEQTEALQRPLKQLAKPQTHQMAALGVFLQSANAR